MMKHFSLRLFLLIAITQMISGCASSVERYMKDREAEEDRYRQETIALLAESSGVRRVESEFFLTPLMAAATLDPRRIRSLIESGEDVTYSVPFPGAFIFSGGHTALHLLVGRYHIYNLYWNGETDQVHYNESHDIAVLEALLKAGADPNAEDSDGLTSLHLLFAQG
ncbi:hypothetical protein [Microbulbifer aggregans]|uniref:hypothetical protein n=1 Tax=Microbulbifer aggregans TaxID=1769779 RepID=UPI001CFC646F|nr:hypothetical protein [Microbulbifer aggregans]